MRRRILPIVALLATAALAACSDATAPTQRQLSAKKPSADDVCSGYITPAGECIPDDGGEGGGGPL